MVLPGGIDVARNSLQTASNSYAEIQKQLDRYNKVFEVYAQASPETQLRAASVMRQAIDEYNGLKKQQEENTIKIYEAQSWLDYYKNNGGGTVQPIVQNTLNQGTSFNNEIPTNAPQEVPVITTATPGTLNNNVNSTLMDEDALNSQTMDIPAANNINQNSINPTAPISMTNYVTYQQPQNANKNYYNYSGANYGAGSTVGINNNRIYNTNNYGKKMPVRRKLNILRNK